MKKILIFNTSTGDKRPLIALFEELAKKNFSFYLVSPENSLALYFIKNRWFYKKINLGPKNKKILDKIFFLLFLPLLYVKFFIFLLYKKIKKSISIIICFDRNEKIVITPLAKILKIKTVWVEDAPVISKKIKINRLTEFAYKRLARNISIIVFNEQIKNNLINIGLKAENIHNIRPAIKLKQHEHQENIFSELAQNDSLEYKRKFFTVGTISDLDKKQKIENLFKAVKICLAIIPNIQLVIVGDGKERKNLNWLAEKMGIGHITWFVGTQGHIRKWLDSFDLFVASNESAGLADYDIILKVMASETPILAQSGLGLEEIVPAIDNNFNFFPEDDYEALAGQIIKLRRNKILRNNLIRLEKKYLEKNFLIEAQAEKIEKILN